MRLLRATATVGLFTLASRILGLVRDVLLARYLGAGVVNDALVTAMKLPNLFRRMFAEGAFNAAFVPLYARRLEDEGEAAAQRFAGEAMSALALVTALIVVAFQVTMPWSLNMVGFGLDRDTSAAGFAPYDLAVTYARITMPYLFLMSVSALLSGLLNTHNRFAAAAFAPVLLNVLLIAVLLASPFADWTLPRLALWISAGMSVSGLFQAGLLLMAVRRAGQGFRLPRPRLTPGVKRLVALGLPGLVAAGITQINVTVSHSIATLQDSAASWLYYSDRLYQLPLGLIGIALGIALLPSLSRSLRGGREDEAAHTFNRGFEFALLLTLPASVALAVMPELLVGGLFERGRFTATDTAQAARALRMFALGLPAFVLLKVLTPAFFARENTRTPMVWAAVSALVNLGLGAGLFFHGPAPIGGFVGLALATSVAAWTNLAALAMILRAQGRFGLDRRTRARLPRIALAALLMGLALWWAREPASGGLSGRMLSDYLWLALVCAGGAGVYALSALALGALRPRELRAALAK